MDNLPDKILVDENSVEEVAGHQVYQDSKFDEGRAELIDEVHHALVDEVNRQAMEKHPDDRTNALVRAQTVFARLDMEKLATAALDAFQDRVALELAKNITRIKEQHDPSSVKFGGHDR